jgi:hypothetical protein
MLVGTSVSNHRVDASRSNRAMIGHLHEMEIKEIETPPGLSG